MEIACDKEAACDRINAFYKVHIVIAENRHQWLKKEGSNTGQFYIFEN